ncbi:RHS repeat-associated core domain-containing protein [Streptomyces parvus]|uniref:RHS repeat-associated core domain-containing protein n=1 Tax=Streptomyces parvus TaxID=66428 RepID=UPI00362678CB
MPAVKVGRTEAPDGAREKISDQVAEWRAAQKARARATTARPSAKAVAPLAAYVPKGQGQVPWHQVSDVRVTDSLVARVNYSTGNLMLAATDFNVAGVGKTLQLSRTYNSLDAPWGKVSQRWWQGYERYLQVQDAENEVVLYDTTGGAVTFTKAADGTYNTPKGYRLDFERTSSGEYTVTERGSGAKDTYSASGTLVKMSDRNGGHVLVEQHDAGAEHKGFKLTESRSGRTVDLVRTDASQWQAKDNAGRTVVYDLDPAGDLVRTTDAEGKATSFGYDTDRRLTKITTPEGRVTVFTYDAQNRVTSMKRATGFNASGETGPTYTYAYTDGEGQAGATTVTDPAGSTTRYEHKADGEITKVTDALGRNRERTYDANLNLETAADAMGAGSDPANVTAYGWDTRSNPISLKLPTGATSALTGYRTIAGADVPGKVSSADGVEVSYDYDTAGNTTKETVAGPEGGTRSFAYNPENATCGGFEGQRCEVKDANGHSTKFSYDAKGNLTKVTPPGPLGATSYTYDSLGRAETAIDGRGVKTVYVYDNRDRITKVSSTSATVTYAYDGDGNLKQRSDSTGITTYDFDPLNRETIRTLQDGSQTVLAYTPEGNIESYTDPSGTVKYTYTKTNNLQSLTDPDGRKTTYEYNANDARTKRNLPSGIVETTTRDKSNRVTRVTATSEAEGTLTDLAYSYAYVEGGVTKDGTRIRTRTDAVDGLKRTFDHDSAGRLRHATETEGATLNNSWLYCYDKAGNLTSQNGNLPATHALQAGDACPGGTTYTYDDASQLTGVNGSTSGWSYDKAGNETAGAPTPETARSGGQWSDFSQLTSLTQGGTDFKGRYASTDQSERTQFGDTTYHHGPVGLSAQTRAGVDMNFTREPSGTLNAFRTKGESYYYLTDALGTVEAVVNHRGEKVNWYYYSPGGITDATEQITQPYRYAGGYQDATGLYHNKARYYDPNIGRFTQPDPSGLEANPYLYASGDPTNRIDPSGLFGWDDFFTTIGTSVTIGGGAGAFGGCVIAGTFTGGIGCPAGAATGAGLGAAGGFVVGIPLGIWRGWGK